MTLSRRGFVTGVTAAAVTGPLHLRGQASRPPRSSTSFDPWIEVDPRALAHNVGVVSGLTGGRPILAVVKNNAYGLGLAEVARILEPMPAIAGFAVVKAAAALGLREAGIRKPVLLMGLFGDEEGAELVARDVHLALSTTDAGDRLERAGRATGRRPRGHAYLDTGMSRMGVPYHRALPWLETLGNRDLTVDGTFMAFTEDPDFDREQLRRFREVVETARSAGVATGALHAASSNGVFHLPEAHLDLVRPGIALFGGYPSDWERERALAELRPAVRLRARVVRVERLRPGDGVSYGRDYVAQRPTWIATLPVGHTDGVPREAVRGAKVLIGERLYPIIGAVSASHAIVEMGEEETVRIGDEATLVGPDHPDIGPNAVAAATGRSVYDIFMHLDRGLPRVVLPGA
ncbi:MAG: alanine racemase [Gemmatimonadota bacterium]